MPSVDVNRFSFSFTGLITTTLCRRFPCTQVNDHQFMVQGSAQSAGEGVGRSTVGAVPLECLRRSRQPRRP
jgi:hypothetical protein